MRAIDIHAHWYPQEWLQLFEKDGAKEGARLERTAGGYRLKTETLVNSFDERFVELASRIEKMDEKRFWAVYAKAEELGWAIFLHPVETIGRERTGKYYLRNLLGNPYDTGVAAAHLIFGGVLDRFAKLEINLPHAGGAFPGLIGRLDHGTKVRPELKHMKRLPSEYLRRFTYDTIGHDDRINMNLIRLVGADRVTLGSDYCFDMGLEDPLAAVQRLQLSAKEKGLIAGGNAARLLRL